MTEEADEEKARRRATCYPQRPFCSLWAYLRWARSPLRGRPGKRGRNPWRRAVTRASVQCYAIEGRYPPSVEYLEENYGVRIDRDRYNVFYNGFASNVMPEIVINPIEEEEARR